MTPAKLFTDHVSLGHAVYQRMPSSIYYRQLGHCLDTFPSRQRMPGPFCNVVTPHLALHISRSQDLLKRTPIPSESQTRITTLTHICTSQNPQGWVLGEAFVRVFTSLSPRQLACQEPHPSPPLLLVFVAACTHMCARMWRSGSALALIARDLSLAWGSVSKLD